MVGLGSEDAAASFAPLRPTLLRIAYRMLGSVSDAEDIVQDAFVRWLRIDRGEIRSPDAFLRRMVTRLCLDELKTARRRRESYIGPWLPEPVVEEAEVEDVTLPLMLALERLTPLERAAFLLHDVFGATFEEVADTIDREAGACRQLAARARNHVREARPRAKVERQRGLALAEAFFAASRSGDTEKLKALLADDVSLHTDGGGKRPAALRPIFGLDAVLRLYKRLPGSVSQPIHYGFINGLPGCVTREQDGELQTTALAIVHGKIAAIYVVRNPDKLRHLH